MRKFPTLILLCGATQLASAQTLTADEYWQAALALVDDHIAMDAAGVFLDDQTIEGDRRLGIEFDHPILAGAEPGGFYARPPGSEWLSRFEALQDADVEGGPFAHCVSVPALLITDFVCPNEVGKLYTSSGDFDLTEKIIALFHLARVCRETPEACAPYLDD